MSKLGEALRKSRGTEPRDVVAKRLGIGRNTLARYETGESVPDLDFLKRFAQFYRIDIAEFLAEPTSSPNSEPAANSHPNINIGGNVQVPLWNAEAGAGAAQAPSHESISSFMGIPKEWLLAWAIQPSHAALLPARGDSMEPTFSDGDLLLIDRAPAPLADAIYVIQLDGDLRVKRLQRRGKNNVAIMSDNKLFPEELVLVTDIEGDNLKGRVRAVFKKV